MKKNSFFRKSLVFGVIFLFIGISVNSFTAIEIVNIFGSPFYDGNTLYVGGSGSGNYSKIKYAVENATDGDTVFVFDDSAPYYENVVVSKSINLIGEDKNTTIIDANGSGSVVRLAHNHITVSGFTLRNSGNRPEAESGVEMSRMSAQSDNCKIFDNIIKNNYDGIHSVWSENCNITGNIIMNNRNNGIYLRAIITNYNVSYNIIKNNDKTGIENYDDSIIFRNIVENNSNGIITAHEVVENIVRNNNHGIKSYAGRGVTNVSRNIVENNKVGIFPELAIFYKIKNNNLIDNEQHVSFQGFMLLLLFPFIFQDFFKKWVANYYEGHQSGIKIIKGTLLLLVLYVYFEFEIPWREFDLYPLKEPYDLDWLEGEILSKIKI